MRFYEHRNDCRDANILRINSRFVTLHAERLNVVLKIITEVMEDRYAPPFCSCGCHAPRPLKSIEPPHEPCCCCEYNPFSDNSKESEIYDLPFALRKLTVMKCQMKKWRMERLQLESENRSLKQALQSFGIDVPFYIYIYIAELIALLLLIYYYVSYISFKSY